MLTQLRFQNFKSWKDTGEIRMAPLTGLFGTNSSGKTAILQFLLMQKQTVESVDQNLVLNLGSTNAIVDLNGTSNIVHKKYDKSQVFFSLNWTAPQPPKLPSSASLLMLGDKQSLVMESSLYKGEINFETLINIELQSHQIELERFSYKFFDSNNSPVKVGVQLSPQTFILNKRNYHLDWKGEILERVWRKPQLDQDTTPMKNYAFPITSSRGKSSQVLSELVLSFEEQFKEIYYLGPLRDYPKYTYQWSGERPTDVGQRGEFTAQALLAPLDEGRTIQTKVAYWLKKLGLVEDFSVEPIAPNRREYEILVQRSPSSMTVPLPNIGFGVSQILPVLTLCYYVPEGSTVIFEQPEIHMHPSVQAGLADVFIDIIKSRNVQVVVESHSEHLLRRLQRRIAEEKLNSDSAALYFCDMGKDGASTLLPLELDTYGNINNWPKGFFGDEMGELFAMSEAAFERQMRDEKAS